MDYDVEPLEPSIWLEQLRNLAAWPQASEEGLAPPLRRAFHLVQLAPRPLRHIVVCNVSEEQFDKWVDTGAMLSAAVALIGDELSYTLSHMEQAYRVEAEVWLPNECQVGRAAEGSPAHALFNAWLACLCALQQPGGRLAAETASLPVRRKSRSGPRRKLTEH